MRAITAFAFLALATLSTSAARADTTVGWGNAYYGELGDGALEFYQSAPVAAIGLDHGVTQVAAGHEHSLVINNGGVFAFGHNGDGQVGIGVQTFSQPTPVAVIGLTSGVTDVAAGWFHSLAIKEGGVYGWGGNYDGELGSDTFGVYPFPEAVAGLASGVTDVAAGNFFSMAIKNGGLYAWGYNGYGELGNGTSANRMPTPAPVSGLTTGVTDISSGGHHSLAIKDGGAYAWGRNYEGQIGNGMILTGFPHGVLIPTPVDGLTSSVTDVAAGQAHSLVVKDGLVYAWGANFRGEIGDGTTIMRRSPRLIDPANVNNIVAVAAGTATSYALSSDGSLWVWGLNVSGQLGLGTDVEQYLTPQHLLPPPGYKFTSISALTSHALATLAAIPEPSTAALLFIGAANMVALRRRRGSS